MSREQSFLKALFFGVVAEDMVFPYPEIGPDERTLTHQRVDALRRMMESEVRSSEIDAEARIPDVVIERLRELGAFGLIAPRELGGSGVSALSFARVISEVSSIDASLGLTLLTHQAIAMRALLSFGSEEQKQRFVPALASGERRAAFALTAESAGTDAGATRTHAVKEDGHWVINGHKPWVTNGEHADLIVLFARTSRMAEGQKPRLTAFLAERGPGLEITGRRDLLGLRGAGVARVNVKNLRVPDSAVLAEPGKGFRIAMEVMTDARVAIASWLFGQIRALINLTVARVQQRRSFGRAIGEFPILKNKLSKMLSDAFAVESMTYLTAGLLDRSVDDYSLESAICRVAAAEALWRAANEAMQLAGGSGYLGTLPLERRLRDARGGLVVDGTTETLRCFIALSGLRGPGERMSDVEGAIIEPVKGFGLLKSFAVRKVREAMRRERLSRAHALLAREAVLFEEGVDGLESAAQRVLREHGREIPEMQLLQVRIANVVIDLYALVACISRTTAAIERRGESGAQRELDLTMMFAAAARGRIRANLSRIDHNDDGMRKLIAARTYTDGGYPFDVL